MTYSQATLQFDRTASVIPELLPWRMLLGEGQPIVKKILNGWETLLGNPSVPERVLHRFIARHAALFFGPFNLIGSKIELGSDFQIDFVVGFDDRSAGILYQLVEIKLPTATPYTRSGNPSAQLAHAVQQILDWKRWIVTHRREYKKIFPSKYKRFEEQDNYRFLIYIGRRDEGSRLTSMRNEYAKQVGIEIRSFDSLTDRPRTPLIPNRFGAYSSELQRLPVRMSNWLVNPFSTAYSWAQWKNMMAEHEFDPVHFPANSPEILLKYRTYGPGLNSFKRLWRSLPEEKRQLYLSQVRAER